MREPYMPSSLTILSFPQEIRLKVAMYNRWSNESMAQKVVGGGIS